MQKNHQIGQFFKTPNAAWDEELSHSFWLLLYLKSDPTRAQTPPLSASAFWCTQASILQTDLILRGQPTTQTGEKSWRISEVWASRLSVRAGKPTASTLWQSRAAASARSSEAI